MKPGFKTSEFWLAFAGVLSTLLVRRLPAECPWGLVADTLLAAAGIGANVYLAARYIYLRSNLKMGRMQLEFRQALDEREESPPDRLVSGKIFGFAQAMNGVTRAEDEEE